MALGKSIALAAIVLGGATVAAHAQYYYPPAPSYYPPPPPSWSYDPYTSGQTACPQKRPGDTQPCRDIMPPTYGQPSYWPQR